VKGSSKSERRTGPVRKRLRRLVRRPRHPRRLAGVAIALAVVVLVVVLHLYVSVTSRFGEGIWSLPSKVYSDVLVLRPGDEVGLERVAERLAETGYAAAESLVRPGQYRRRGLRLEAFLRRVDVPGHDRPALRVALEFDASHVRSIRDEQGRRLDAVVLEPVLIGSVYGPRQEDRELLHLEEVPQPFLRAVLAAEDARFDRHHGLDLRGITRAAWTNFTSGRIVQGGSTITQQTIKNLYLGQQRTWWRKAREAAMAVILDARYSKAQILEVYLNEVYLGQRGSVAICGVQAASRFYFGRPLDELSLGEQALLAGLIRSPGFYNPFQHPERAAERRAFVLAAMERLGWIDGPQRERAAAEPLRVVDRELALSRAPYAVDWVLSELGELYPRSVLAARGLRIHTTIDPSIQRDAELALKNGLERLEQSFPTLRRQVAERRLQGAVIVTQPETGAILAMVGGRDHGASQFNRATQALRQPGSCFKPFVFAAGFELGMLGRENGLSPASLLEDSPFELVSGGKRWRPENYDNEYRGQVTVRAALEQSLNIPTVRAAQAVGLDAVIDVARACGITSPMSAVPSLALGTAEVTPLELATAYGVFAAGGVRHDPWIIRALTDSKGELLEGREVQPQPGLSQESAFLVGELLRGVFLRGTARSAPAHGFRGEAAGKTGTTDDMRDAWFVGYTDQLLSLVWVGYDDNARTGLTGASGALPIWVDLMRRADPHSTLTAARPPDIVSREIDPASGMLARSGCPEVVEEYFVRGMEPQEDCPLHRGRFQRWLERFLGKRSLRDDGVPGV